MAKLKVLQIIDSLHVGGAEVLAVNIANALAEKNVESHLCVSRKEGDLKQNIDKNVGYVFLNRKSTFDVVAILKLKKYIKKNDIQIVHAHSTSSFIAFCIKIVSPKVKVVWHDHFGDSEFLNQRKKQPLRFFSLFFSQIITVNTKLKNWAITNLRCKKVEFINNFATFQNKEKNTILHGVTGKKIVHLAGFRKQKDHLMLLQAFLLVHIKYPEWSLHLIGKDYQDAYSEKIKDFIKEHHLKEFVFLYGVQADIEYILSQATIGVLSSASEGLPIALLEYGLAGLPVLVTDVGECKQVINNPNAVVNSKDSVSFAKALEQIISNEAIRKQIQEDLQVAIKDKFSKKAIIEQLIHIYTTAC